MNPSWGLCNKAVQITQKQDLQFANVLEAKPRQELRDASKQGENTSFSLQLGSSDGALLGGLSASTSYGWLLIKVIFVEPSARGHWYGRGLLEDAIKRAKGLGCHSVWLDTSNPLAHRFYLKQGFETFGSLSNESDCAPSRHQRWFMKRAI